MVPGSCASAVGRHSPASSIAVLWCSAIRPSQASQYVVRGLGLALLPAQPLEPQPLHLPAMRARHEVAPLVAMPRTRARCARGRGSSASRRGTPWTPGEGPRARLGERDRIAFLVGRGRIGVDLVEEEVARRHRAQADRAVGAGDDQEPAGNSFDSTVLPASRERAGFTRSRSAGLSLDQRIDALAREALGELDRRLHREHRPRRMMDDVADPVVARLPWRRPAPPS